MRKLLTLLAFIAAFAAPAGAQTSPAANPVDPTLIPDGTYTATVEKVVDNKHVMVKLDNGMEATVTTNRPNVDFGKVKPNDQIKMSLIKGQVAVYIVTTH